MSVFINPLTDTGFKIIFGKEGTSEEFLMDFLNELFKGDSDLGNIVTLIYKNEWIYVLKNMETMREMPFKAMSDRVFERLGKVSRMSALSEEERISYDRDLKWALDYRAEIKYARDMAIKEGREEGIEKGREEGRNEEKYIIARNMKNAGLDVQLISLTTGLSKDEILQIS